MLTNQQKSLLKRAQREAGLNDMEYRDILDTCTGARTSTAPELGDTHLDTLMKYIEAIYWRNFDLRSAGVSPAESRVSRDSSSQRPSRIFTRRGYWASKNVRGNTSRDRYMASNIEADIRALEFELTRLIGNPHYAGAIRRKIISDTGEAPRPEELAAYRASLIRTIAYKRKAKTRNADFQSAVSPSSTRQSVHSHDNQPFQSNHENQSHA